MCILIDKNLVVSIHTRCVSVAVSGKGQPEPLQNGLCHQGRGVCDSAFVPCSGLLSTNAMTVARVMINTNEHSDAYMFVAMQASRLWQQLPGDFDYMAN